MRSRYGARHAALACLFLVATSCEELTGPPALEPGFARFEGTINDGSGSPLSGADVQLPFGNNQYWGSTTDSKGKFRFDAQVSDYYGATPVALIVKKAGYRSKSFYQTNVTDGTTYTANATGSGGLPALAVNEFVPEGGEWVWHVGDDDFGGSNNSGLQMKTTGLFRSMKIVDWNASYRALYKTAQIEVYGRGIQTSVCPGNRFGVYGNLSASNFVEVAPPDSPTAGGYGVYTLTFPMDAFTSDFPVYFGVKAGSCPSSTGYDDYEVTQIFVTFKP